MIAFFLEPAMICFAIPLYKKREVLGEYWFQILGGLTVGSIISIAAIDAVGKLFGLDEVFLASLLPQAATTAIAMPTAQSIGGILEIASLACILNAVIIYSLGKPLVELFI
ncbi:MAG: LrgB family protein [Turicibacter sp.]|nr:LrgB family protein [Turicibacter sp.]